MRWKRARNGNRKRARSQCNEEGSSTSPFSSLLALIIYKPSKLTLFPLFNIDADTVMKNPFHTLEMPINSALFDEKLGVLMGGVNV